MKLRFLLAPALLAPLLLTGWGASPSVAADDDPSVVWGVQAADDGTAEARPNFAYDVEPGGSVEDALVVSNYDDEPITLDVYAADGYLTETGMLDLLPAGTPSKDLGTWVTPDVAEVTIAPGESETVPFTVVIPPDAAPGDHTGGLVTSMRTASNDSGVTVDRRLGVRIHARVGGLFTSTVEVRDLKVDYDQSVTPFTSGAATVSYEVVNTGNVRAETTQTVHASGLLGGFGTNTVPPEPVELLPGTSLRFEVPLEGVAPSGRVTATVDVVAKPVGDLGLTSGIASSSAEAWAVPWTSLAVVLLVGLAVVVMVLNRRRRVAAQQRRIAAAIEAALADAEPPRFVR